MIMPQRDEPAGMQVDYEALGKRLVIEREKKGWTLEQVSEALRIKPEWVRALEQGHFSVFPGVVYAKGYLANYARLLEIESVLEHPPLKDAGMVRVPQPAAVSSVAARSVAVSAPKVSSSAYAYKAPMTSSHGVLTRTSVFGRFIACCAGLFAPKAERMPMHRTPSNGIFSLQSLLISACIAGALFFVGYMIQERSHRETMAVTTVKAVPKQMDNYLKTGLPAESGVDIGSPTQPTPVASCAKDSVIQAWPPCYDAAAVLKQQEIRSLLTIAHPLDVVLGN